MLYAGSRFALSELVSLAPELVLDRYEERDDRRAVPASDGVLGKLSFPLMVVLDRARDAQLVFDAGLKLHKLEFGGARMTLSVPF